MERAKDHFVNSWLGEYLKMRSFWVIRNITFKQRINKEFIGFFFCDNYKLTQIKTRYLRIKLKQVPLKKTE